MSCNEKSPHYHIELVIDKKTVEVIRNQFPEYIKTVGSISVMVVSHTDNIEPSPELQNAIGGMFKALMATLTESQFQTIQ